MIRLELDKRIKSVRYFDLRVRPLNSKKFDTLTPSSILCIQPPIPAMFQRLTIPVTAFEQNCSLVWCDETGNAALIDPGGDIPVLEQAIRERELDLKAIWLTHAHIDHAGATGTLARTHCVFRSKPPPVPVQTHRCFRFKPATDSDPIPPPSLPGCGWQSTGAELSTAAVGWRLRRTDRRRGGHNSCSARQRFLAGLRRHTST